MASPATSSSGRTLTRREKSDQQHFDSIASNYGRKDQTRSSRIARRHRLLQTVRQVPLTPQSDVLEVGCGAGFASHYLSGRYRTYCGVDYSKRLIASAQSHYQRPGVEFHAANIKGFEPRRTYDVVFMIGVLHHVDELEATVCCLVKFLKPGGWLVANEPQPGNPLVTLARKIRKKIDVAYADDQVELKAKVLRDAFGSVGLANLRCMPQGIFSTPFAEVSPAWQTVAAPLASGAVLLDFLLERSLGKLLFPASWNLIVAGQRSQ